MKTSPEQLLGKPWLASEVQAFVTSFPSEAKVTTIEDRTYHEFREAGFTITTNQGGRVIGLHLYSIGREGFHGFAGGLPAGLTMTATKTEVNERLGRPDRTGGGEVTPLGIAGVWERYDLAQCSVHVEYQESGRHIGLVTLMAPEDTPGRILPS